MRARLAVSAVRFSSVFFFAVLVVVGLDRPVFRGLTAAILDPARFSLHRLGQLVLLCSVLMLVVALAVNLYALRSELRRKGWRAFRSFAQSPALATVARTDWLATIGFVIGGLAMILLALEPAAG